MIGRLRALLARRRERWESLCRRCGACCYEKSRRGGEVIVNWRVSCRWLDPASRQCAVYDRRFAVCPECRPMTVLNALFTTWLPEQCGYVRAYRHPWIPAHRALKRRPPPEV